MNIIFNGKYSFNPKLIARVIQTEEAFGDNRFRISVGSATDGITLHYQTAKERDESFEKIQDLIKCLTTDFVTIKKIRINKSSIKTYYIEQGLRKPDGEGGEIKIGQDHLVVIYEGETTNEVIKLSEEETGDKTLNEIITELDKSNQPHFIF